MRTIKEDIALINSTFGSETAARQFLETEGKNLCLQICSEKVIIPRFEIRPSMMATGTIFNTGLRSAEYEPAEGEHSATIILYPSVLHDKKLTIIALAHELIHHWENACDTKKFKSEYPKDAEIIITASFGSEIKIKKWKSGHSPKFIAKAFEVSQFLKVSLQQMLVHR